MSKKKLSLEEAKQILKSDKVFYNGSSKFNYLDLGKYNSGITIEIPQEWTIDKKRKPENPINYLKEPKLTDGMNVDFDGSASILLGKYRLSKNGRPVFELTEPTKAKDVLVEVSWGGPFNSSRGQNHSYAKETGASFFTKRCSNGGGTGSDYWILPVNFVKDMDSRDVSDILLNIENREKQRILDIDNFLEKEDLEINNSLQNRERILEQIQPTLEQISTISPTFKFEAQQDQFTYYESGYWSGKKQRYSDDLVVELNNLLETHLVNKAKRDTYEPIFNEMEQTLTTLNISINYYDTYVTLTLPSKSYDYRKYSYSQDGYNSFIQDVFQYQEKIKKEQEEARIKAEELKKAAELKIKKEKAKKCNYPEIFEFYNRLSGATNLSHAYVIESDGTIREPDYNNLRNRNHIHHSNWKNIADGTQGYLQLLPGEMIVTYTKDYTAVPYIFNVEWADSKITEAQLETICNELEKESSFAETSDGKEITDLRKWAIDATNAKCLECRNQLNLESEIEKPSQTSSFEESIVELAKQKVEERSKNEQAKELTKKYELYSTSIQKESSLEEN